jgi:hypothetical protein
MWWSRDDWLAHGPPCTEGGPYDCARDPGLAAGYGLVVGGAFAVAVGAAWLVSRRLPRLGTTLAAGVAAGWVVVATVLLQGTRR